MNFYFLSELLFLKCQSLQQLINTGCNLRQFIGSLEIHMYWHKFHDVFLHVWTAATSLEPRLVSYINLNQVTFGPTPNQITLITKQSHWKISQ